MAKTNTKRVGVPLYTAEGAPAQHVNPYQQLRRSICACLLWEKEFYEDGQAIAERVAELVKSCDPQDVAALAIEAREQFNLRHMPLFLVRELARHPRRPEQLVAKTLARVVQRADELSEFLAIYWREGKCPLAKQVKRGLAWALHKFDAHQLAKYDRENAIRLRDVLFLTHARPRNDAEAALWKQLAAQELATPDTWETELSAGKDKRATFERLIRERKLGYLALLRNLRKMQQAGCDETLVQDAIRARRGGAERVLPFRFVAAAKAAPRFEAALDEAMLATLAQAPKLGGKTILVIDVSGSMYYARASAKSDMDRAQVGAALGAVGRELCEEARVYATAGNDGTRMHATAEVAGRHGMALVEAIYAQCTPLGGGGIFLTPVMRYLQEREKTADRIIVITDEQDCALAAADSPLKAVPFGHWNYIVNVASNRNGIGYKPHWTHIDGWSEAVFRFIVEHEHLEQT